MLKNPRQGKWIIIEGGDGYGKTTQEKLLKKALSEKGYPVVMEPVREPGGTKIGEAVREFLIDPQYNNLRSPAGQVLGYNYARAVLIHSRIKPLLSFGRIIISDRSWLSTIAYQAFAEQVSKEALINICEFALDGLFPDQIFVLDVSPEEARRRLQERGEALNNYDAKPIEFHERVHQGYMY